MPNFNISPKTLVAAFLLFCVLSSKNIIIYNEETLITLSFILFIFFVFRYFASTIKDSLDERSESIKTECQNFLHYKQQSLQQLSAEHKKIGQLHQALSQLMHFIKSTTTQLTGTGKRALQVFFSKQMVEKCNECGSSQLPQNLQHLMAENQQQLVLARCAKRSATNLSPSVLKNAIQLLISTVKKK